MTLAETKICFTADSNFFVIHWSATMAKANQLMQMRSIRHLPVVDDSNAIIGILSDRDVLRAMRTDREQFNLEIPSDELFDSDALVVNFMSRPVVTIDSNRTLKDAAQEMIERNVSSLIVTSNGFAIGVTTTHDILTAVLNEQDSLLVELKEQLKATILQSPVGAIVQRLADIGI